MFFLPADMIGDASIALLTEGVATSENNLRTALERLMDRNLEQFTANMTGIT